MPYVEKLKMIRDAKGLTNVEIARLADIPLATVTRVFNGKTPNPTFETLSKMAIGIGVSLDELVGLKQPDAPPIASPIETTLTSYSELLREKDDRIAELKEEKAKERKEKHILVGLFTGILAFVLLLLAIDLILGGDFGYFRY